MFGNDIWFVGLYLKNEFLVSSGVLQLNWKCSAGVCIPLACSLCTARTFGSSFQELHYVREHPGFGDWPGE